MSDRVNVIVRTREQAHQAITHGYALAKALLQDGKRVSVNIGEDEEPLTVKQRKFFHGVVLMQIAEQVRVEGQRYTLEVWKDYFRKLFLGSGGYRYVMRKQPRWDAATGRLVVPKKATPKRELVSTESLSIKQYSELIDKVIAHAQTDLGVQFHFIDFEREEVRWKPPVRKQRTEPAAEPA